MAGVKGRSGGKRAGAGRKPTREKHATAIAKAEKQIADRLPDLVDKLLDLAEEGDIKALCYAMDRVMGKPTQTVDADLTTGGQPFKSYAGIDTEQV
jgi:hypothetical protein